MSAPTRTRPAARLSDFLLAAVADIGLGLASIVLLPLLIVSVALITVWIGIPLLMVVLRPIRAVSQGYRRVAARLLGTPATSPYRPVPAGGFGDRVRGRLTDRSGQRDLLWLPISACLALPLGIVALVFYLVFPLGVICSPLMLRVFATLSGAVLSRQDPDGTAELSERIGALTRSRSDAVDAQSSELRRIERDLHDGAQAQLVALSMNLGLAGQLVDRDPAASRELIEESRLAAGSALADLRGLVRGILPPVLADRGLVGAVQALALGQPVPTEVDIELPGRPPAPIESAVYFAVAEALTNSAKHAAARRCWVWGRYCDDRLRLTVGDDGVGGAIAAPGGGLAGIGRRLAAFDGSVTVASPLAGGTIVSMELPCESFSAKT